MNILVLHNKYQQDGGEDAVVAAEVSMLGSANHNVRLELLDNASISSLKEKVFTFVNTPYNRHSAKWLENLVRLHVPDIIHVHNFFPLMTPAVHETAFTLGIPLVQTLHNYRLLCANAQFLRGGQICEKCISGSSAWGIVHRCYRNSLPGSIAVVRMQQRANIKKTWSKVSRFIALTKFARQKFIEGGIPASKIVVKPNFYMGNEFEDVGPRNGALFVGRLSAEKGIDMLVEAWAAFPDHILTVVGDGPLRTTLEASAPSNVNFLGFQPPNVVQKKMRQSSLMIVPSIWYEGFPMIVVEAYANGLPVVASRIGSLNEIVEDGVTGGLFDVSDMGDMARVTKRILSSANTINNFSVNARDRYKEKFNKDANLKEIMEIYKCSLDEKRWNV